MVDLFPRLVSAPSALSVAGALAAVLAGLWAGPALAAPGPLAPAYEPRDQVCMIYYHQQGQGDILHTTAGKACRGPDGAWRPAEFGPAIRQEFSGVPAVNPAVAARHRIAY